MWYLNEIILKERKRKKVQKCPKFSASASSVLLLSQTVLVVESWVAMETESLTCLIMRMLLSMTTQLFPLSFTFGTLLITLHILHNTQIKGSFRARHPAHAKNLIHWWELALSNVHSYSWRNTFMGSINIRKQTLHESTAGSNTSFSLLHFVFFQIGNSLKRLMPIILTNMGISITAI